MHKQKYQKSVAIGILKPMSAAQKMRSRVEHTAELTKTDAA
ncbi:hypothetical protein BH11PAT2_BH11PAT2_06710 [soil metagenome]